MYLSVREGLATLQKVPSWVPDAVSLSERGDTPLATTETIEMATRMPGHRALVDQSGWQRELRPLAVRHVVARRRR